MDSLTKRRERPNIKKYILDKGKSKVIKLDSLALKNVQFI